MRGRRGWIRICLYAWFIRRLFSFTFPTNTFTVSTWQCRFAAECVAEVTSRTLTAEAPTYATIMELDKKVREFPLPEEMASGDSKTKVKGRGGEGEGEGDLAGSFQRCVLDHIRETG